MNQVSIQTQATSSSAQMAATIGNGKNSVAKPKKTKYSVTHLTFTDCLAQIDVARQRSDAAFYKLIHAVIIAHQVGFGDGLSKDRLAANDDALNKLCNARDITGSGRVAKLCKLAITDDSKRVYPVVYVVDVAIARIRSNQLTLSGFIVWVNDNEGLQKIRLKFNRDGSPKEGTTSNQKQSAAQLKANIELAEKRIGDQVLATLPASAISPFAKHGETADCAAIISQLADGSYVIREIVSDANVVRSALAAIGRKLSENS